ncbi:hypothetical protein [Thermodesulforhabdus norvegica]|uniref:Uncharacterized protein n=1 Tax=Thermodesulforhabdus norvegica TaxID=39841 RepID=A0A1I4TX19_9BACT|nr:hypothetical protein [Thermodesulforhabdus norvegica]SFM81338.1 hypothetical protein SAMN05660836_01575 [Thermodesulforhabdus norvegica]
MADLKKDMHERLLRCAENIPSYFRRSDTIRRTLQCELYFFMREAGYGAVADYYPPRISDRPVDLIVYDPSDPKKILWALCIDELITLHAVRSLTSFDAENRIIFTTHPLEKKVNESTFFLKPGVEHVHLRIK